MVSEVHLVINKDTKRPKGFTFVNYTHPEFAASALEELDNSIFQGRLLHVMPAKQRISSERIEPDAAASHQKKGRHQKLVETQKQGMLCSCALMLYVEQNYMCKWFQ